MDASDKDVEHHSPSILRETEARGVPGFKKAFDLFNYWQTLSRTDQLHRTDLDPIEIGSEVLPNTVLIDVIDGGADFRWRLFGGAHEREYGVSLKGRSISDVIKTNPNAAEILEIFRQCATSREPVFYEAKYANDKGNLRAARGVLLPLFGENDHDVTCILGCSEWVNLHDL